jgi:hypothetical protein
MTWNDDAQLTLVKPNFQGLAYFNFPFVKRPLDGVAIDILSTKLRTPVQVQLHLTLALEAGYQTGEKPVTAALVETVLSRQLDDLEPTLTRHGYRLKDMVEQFDAKPAEIRALFNNKLEPARTAELRDRMLAAGLPI